MASNIFMSIPGIPGESTDATHAGKIVLVSCEWSFETQVSPETGGLVSPLLPRLIQINKSLDRSTPLLIQAAGTNATLPTCEILGLKAIAGGSVETLWRLVLGGVRVERITQSFNVGGPRPLDQLSLSYSTIQVDMGPKADGSNRYTFSA